MLQGEQAGLFPQYHPHGICYLWEPGLLWLHVASDSLVAVAYYAIPFGLVYLLRKRGDIPFDAIFAMFAVFIVACGTTHLLAVWNVWHADYWISGGVKALTAGVSLVTAAMMIPLVPRAIALPSPNQLREANRTLAQAQRLAKLGTWRVDSDTGDVQLSPEVCEMFGRSAEHRSATLEGLLAHFRAEDRREFERILRGTTADGGEFDFVGRVVLPDGEVRILDTRGERLATEAGTEAGILAVSHDITEAELATDALRDSEERFRRAMHHAAIGKALVKPDGRWMEVNDAICKIVGYTRDELLATDFQSITHPDDLDADLEYVQQMLRGEIETYQMEKRYIHKEGHQVWILLSVSLVHDRDGAPAYFISQIQDISERKRAEAEVRALNRELEDRVRRRTLALEEANQELESFSYSVSHDLRAPIRHIQGYVAELKEETEGTLSAEAEHSLDVVEEAGVRMGQLIDDLLRFSKLGRTGMSKEVVKLDDLFSAEVRVLASSTADRSIEWSVGPLPEVVGDRSLLRQVFANLLGNAVKYTAPKQTAHIEVGRAADTDGLPTVYIRDNGVGFDMAYADKLFGVFQRLHSDAEFQGTGIGLAIVHRIVQRHGGRVWAEAERGGGATFYVALPPAQA